MTEANDQKNMNFPIKEIDINKVEATLTNRIFYTIISIPIAVYLLSFVIPKIATLIDINHYVLLIFFFVFFKFAAPTMILITTVCPYCNKSFFHKKICTSRELKKIIQTTTKCNHCKNNVHLISRHNDPLWATKDEYKSALKQ